MLYMKFFREIRENSIYMKHEQDAGKREGRKERRGAGRVERKQMRAGEREKARGGR